MKWNPLGQQQEWSAHAHIHMLRSNYRTHLHANLCWLETCSIFKIYCHKQITFFSHTRLDSKASALCSSFCRKQFVHLLLLKMFGANFLQSDRPDMIARGQGHSAFTMSPPCTAWCYCKTPTLDDKFAFLKHVL